MVAPGPLAERPQSAGTQTPIPEAPRASRYPLGRWSREGFRFQSPETQRQWDGDAFDQGVHHENWHLGRKLSPEETQLVEIGVPKQHDHYRGPDGVHYQINPVAQEDGKVAALRGAYLAKGPPFERGQSALQH